MIFFKKLKQILSQDPEMEECVRFILEHGCGVKDATQKPLHIICQELNEALNTRKPPDLKWEVAKMVLEKNKRDLKIAKFQVEKEGNLKAE